MIETLTVSGLPKNGRRGAGCESGSETQRMKRRAGSLLVLSHLDRVDIR
jgi:hypothetical protein